MVHELSRLKKYRDSGIFSVAQIIYILINIFGRIFPFRFNPTIRNFFTDDFAFSASATIAKTITHYQISKTAVSILTCAN